MDTQRLRAAVIERADAMLKGPELKALKPTEAASALKDIASVIAALDTKYPEPTPIIRELVDAVEAFLVGSNDKHPGVVRINKALKPFR